MTDFSSKHARGKGVPPKFVSDWRPEWGRCPQTDKRRYPKRATAQKDARRSGRMTAYKCAFCGDYHLTSQSRTMQKVYKLLGATDE